MERVGQTERFSQISVFEALGKKQYKITKPGRLIELFAGIGAQAKALENLGMAFEKYKVCEFENHALASYNAIHETNFKTSDVINLNDLEIVEKDKYEYILTYSFPCTDLSLAGKRAGMKKGSGTRSGLLWEVERLLKESCGLKTHRTPPSSRTTIHSMTDFVDDFNFDIDKSKLPQILLMENVPQVINSDFHDWQRLLEILGYSNYTEILNAKDYGIPQNRDRCYMVSILGDYYYGFPEKQRLQLRLKDMLEDEVDEKYYLSEKATRGIQNSNFVQKQNIIQNPHSICSTILSRDYKDPKCIQVGNLDVKGNDSIKRVYSSDGLSPTITSIQGGNQEPKIMVKGSYNPSSFASGKIVDVNGLAPTVMENHGTVTAIVEEPNLKAQLCNKLIQEDKVRENDVIRHSYSNSRMKGEMKDIQDNNMSPTLDTRCDCLGVVVKEPTILQLRRGYNKGGEKSECPPITSNSWQENNFLKTNLRIRKLTPKECFRLMGFSDQDFEKASKVNSNSQLYKQAGNSIVVNVLMAIFKQFL